MTPASFLCVCFRLENVSGATRLQNLVMALKAMDIDRPVDLVGATALSQEAVMQGLPPQDSAFLDSLIETLNDPKVR